MLEELIPQEAQQSLLIPNNWKITVFEVVLL